MEAHRTEATVGGDGSITVRGLPFPEGEAVEIIVLPSARTEGAAPGRTPDVRARRQVGLAKGLITVPDDFDDPLDDFADYM